MEQQPTSSSSQKHYSNVIDSIIPENTLVTDEPTPDKTAKKIRVYKKCEHGVMGVQGLICETLHPDSLIARLGEFSAEERDYFIRECNAAQMTNDAARFNVARLQIERGPIIAQF